MPEEKKKKKKKEKKGTEKNFWGKMGDFVREKVDCCLE
jgi:hypothetical protein